MWLLITFVVWGDGSIHEYVDAFHDRAGCEAVATYLVEHDLAMVAGCEEE